MRLTLSLIMVACLAGTVRAQAETPKAPEGFQSIFNGKDLTGWDGNAKLWSVQDGAITGQTTAENPTKGNTFLIWKGGVVKDFELRLKIRLDNGNTGIQYRSYLNKDKGNWVVNGYQGDYDDTKQWLGSLYEEGGRGVLAQMGQKVTIGPDGKLKETGKVADVKELRGAIDYKRWVDYVVIAQGNHLVHKLNGTTVVDVTDEQESERAMEGIVALQVHAGPPMKVQFKDIYLKDLSK